MVLESLQFAQVAGRYTTYENMFMLFSMANLTKSYSVVGIIPERRISGERLDMMWMQFNSMTISRTITAFLTGVLIALKNYLSPLGIFAFVSGVSVLVRYINVIFPLGLICFFGLCAGGWVSEFITVTRADLAKLTTFLVFWHWLTADRAGYFDCKTIWANQNNRGNLEGALPTNSTRSPNFYHGLIISQLPNLYEEYYAM